MLPVETDLTNQQFLIREKAAYITKAAKAATIANLFAPALCIALFYEAADHELLFTWALAMLVAVIIRTVIAARLKSRAEEIENPQRDLNSIAFALGLIGIGWGLGWFLVAPDLSEDLRLMYLYIITGAMFLAMFGYGVYWPSFYALAIPSMLPPISSVFWTNQLFPWPFALGITTLFFAGIKIAKNFSLIFDESVSQRFRNNQLYLDLTHERDASIAANLAKSKFIAEASHDLRQPMHAINLYLQVCDPKDMGEKTQLMIQKIRNGVETVNSMFNSLLSISRLDSYAVQNEIQDFQLGMLVENLRSISLPKAEEKGLAISFDFEPCVVRGNKFVLRQILMNLISNAIQYTSVGFITVRFFTDRDFLAIEVLDTGCGISSDDQKHIFEEFFRVNHSRHAHDGLGLGLTLVRRFCDLVGATISVESEQERGSKFTVSTTFPILTELNETNNLLTHTLVKKPQSLIGVTIAIIEDDINIQDGYRYALGEKGARVINISEDVNSWPSEISGVNRIDCIIADYRLKYTTGDILIQELRDFFNTEIPALIVTADTSPSHIKYFQALNVTVLHKPITFGDVLSEVFQILNMQN